MSTGVLVGCDRSQEWLLGWFYGHFRKHNPDVPIAFADFGMSEGALCWCKLRGAVLKIGPISEVSSGQLREWGLDPSSWTRARKICFRKPLALAASPFDRTLWLDLDCQVRASLMDLFAVALDTSGLAAAPCGSLVFVHHLSNRRVFGVDKYNTGVVLAEKSSPVLKEWAKLQKEGISFQTDEGALAWVAQKTGLTELVHEFNWPVALWGPKPEAVIYHWMGKEAKRQLVLEGL